MNHLVQYLAIKHSDSPAELVSKVVCDMHLPQMTDAVHEVFSNNPCEICAEQEENLFMLWMGAQAWLTDFISAEHKTVYIAGPMSGKPDFNRPAFHRMERLIRHECSLVNVLSPAHYPDSRMATGEPYPYEWLMEQGIKMVLNADAVIILVGWPDSRGAKVEHAVAEITGKTIYYEL